MTENVVIFGGKGTAVVIAEPFYDPHEHFGMAFDDPAYKDGINGWPVLCGTREAYDMFKHDESVKFVFALYRSDILKERIALRDSLNIPINRFLSFRHPSAYVAKSAQLGQANIILANCAINNNVVMGNYNTMQTGSLIGHDTHIGNNNFIAAHTCIGSNLKIGNGNFTGLNCSIKNFVVMGDYNLIGMASNVVKDVSDGNILIGNPAKPLVK